CTRGDKCIEPKINDEKVKFTCRSNSAFEIRKAEGEPWIEPTEFDCYNDKMRAISRSEKAKGESLTLFSGIFRCRELRKCIMKKYFDAAQCDKSKICAEPDRSTLQCAPGYNLEYKSVETSPWTKAPNVVCEKNRFVLKDGADSRDEIPLSFRCVLEKKCDLKHYYFQDLCDQDDICQEPTSFPSLSCPSGMSLR
ncbi:hypothetical protein PFISCL1PPCAC_1664, partial [Pristionchus fissidentatus]